MRPPSHIALLVGLLSTGACAKPSPSGSRLDPGAASVCVSTTVNYITQTLPQQCLRTDWSRPGSNGTREAPPTEAEHLSVTLTTTGLSSLTEHIGATSTNPPGRGGAEAHPTADIIQDEEADPLGDEGNFLSFEQWKAQMLEKAGQSPDHIVGATASTSGSEDGRRQPIGINNALDSLGDDGEIELDLSGFVNAETAPGPGQQAQDNPEENVTGDTQEAPQTSYKRSKEAGTTSKERFNYASFDCAATILKTSKGSKGATWILSENKDSYLINKCAEENKHFIVELCNDILIDTIVLGNFEFFSSTFRTFKVSISDRYPVKAEKWREIGTFEARNTRGVQAFMVEDGLIWARYLKVELLTHYGKEYYCPVSLLRVHGTTMMDDYRNEMKDPQEQDDEGDEEALMIGSEDPLLPEIIAIPPIKSKEESTTSIAEDPVTVSASTVQSSTEALTDTSISLGTRDGSIRADNFSTIAFESAQASESVCNSTEQIDKSSVDNSTITHASSLSMVTSETSPDVRMEITPPSSTDTGLPASPAPNATTLVPTTPAVMANISDSNPSAVSESTKEGSDATGTPESTLEIPQEQVSKTGEVPENHTANRTTSIVAPTASMKPESPQNSTSTSTGTNPKIKAAVPIRASPAPPSTQESFFKNVHKRLQMLETNSTLSLLYIEEQSRILRDAFSKVEKRQIQKASAFLDTLNSTVFIQLGQLRTQYDQLWQSTVLELSSQREQVSREGSAMSERLTLVAEKVLWLERLVYLQLVVIVLCLGLVLFQTFGQASGVSAPLELSLLQSIQHLKRDGASMSFSRHYDGSETPRTPSRPNSFGGMFTRTPNHRRELSDGLTSGEDLATNPASSPEQRRKSRLHVRMDSEGTALTNGDRSKSPSVHFEPLTPASEGDEPLSASLETGEDVDIPEADPTMLKRAASSPPLGRQFDVPNDGDTSAAESEMNELSIAETIRQ